MVTDKVKISVVSYLNSKPFLFGIEQSEISKQIDLQLDIPSVCARKLIENQVDIGLVPVAIIPALKQHFIISDYCIGAVGKVSSVMLYSQVPLNAIKQVLLDYQSRTSVTLVKVLAKAYWHISPEWFPATENFEEQIKDTTAAVIIGDRTFGLENKYAYAYDLSEEWQKFTKLPFVFACWVANKELPKSFVTEFNAALKYGIDHRGTLIEALRTAKTYKTDVENYLKNSISYDYDSDKKQALALFLELAAKLS
ncbi:MAG TPA: menaquinone biosynthesis protein [Bacteroidia bacterium]|jgi:chorismate dehydratase|nr:menaquinone biosynthesis protein [Bacteroidia bacterium]HRG53054.1 menaquinone biosynthesis protein [Bacteroidia bacterium]